jgi:two-component system response regulator YesN
MINVMIVDDEVDILYGAQTIIDWNKLGFNLCGLCSNSHEALEIFRRDKPEIVITDIRMPDIDGLTLAKLIRQECEQTKIIILSGYDDFNYAKTAIKIGVSGYLLKPLDETELTLLLNQLKEEISLQQISETRKEKVIGNALNHKIISQLLSNKMPEKKQLDSLGHRLQLIIAKPDTPFIMGCTENTKFETTFKKLSIFFRNNTSLHFEQLFEETAIFVIEASEHPVIKREALVSVNVNSSFSMIISPIISDPATLREVYNYIRTALDIDILFGLPGSIYCYQVIPSNMVKPPLYEFDFEKCKKEISEAMLSMNDMAIQELFSRFLTELRKNRTHISAEMARMFWKRLAVYSRSILKELFQANMDILEDFDFGCGLMEHLPSMQAISEHLYSLLRSALSSIYETPWKNMPIIMRQIILYVRANACREISLKQVAEQFYLNQSYLSRIFREKTGTTFWAYVTDIRIEKARGMLKNECLSLNEIAIQCGFNSVKRLHAVFKKKLGCTPGTYRKQVAK